MSLPASRKFKIGVLATGCAAIIFGGATYGAILKTRQQWQEKRKEFVESPIEDQVAILENQKRHFLEQREMLERKLEIFEERVKEREGKKR